MKGIGTVDPGVFDRPEILRFLFYPRSEWQLPVSEGSSPVLAIPVDEVVMVGGRFHRSSQKAVNLLFFHGNGEIAADYSELAHFYTNRGMNFIPVDYRGYGTSSGIPTVSTMMRDCHLIFAYLKKWLMENAYTGPLVVMGRSLGSASALEIIKEHHQDVAGLIIESGFAHIEPLLALLGVDMASLGLSEDTVFRNVEKIKIFHKPTLVIHAQYDHIIALSEGKELYEACAAKDKKFLQISGANHNNIFVAGMNQYLESIEWLIGRLENKDE